jgi:tryptophan halogenase
MKKKIVIVGGGTAGWINLAYIVAKLKDVDVTIIHSNEIDIIGVGESTSPTIRQVADAVGVDEFTWMRDAKAIFKYGVEFLDWNQKGSRWLHAFEGELPEAAFNNPIIDFGRDNFEQQLSSIDYFLKIRQTDSSYDIDKFNMMHGPMEYMLRTNKGPYTQTGECNISKLPGYAYHVNAFEYSQCLRKHTPKEKFTEIVDTVIDVELDDNGVKSLLTKSGNRVTGDIFIDCTGMKKLLIGKLTGFTKFEGLKNDRAIFGAVTGFKNYTPTTITHAQDAGWIWGTRSWERMGSGHVYASDFISDDAAHDTISKYWADRGCKWNEANRLKFTSGRSTHLAIKNVVSNGLSQSFVEPLEGTSIMVTAWTVIRFVEIYERNGGWGEKSSRMLHSVMNSFLEIVESFVKYHYSLSDRTDTDYWMSYKNPNAVQEVNDIISSKLKGPMLGKGVTALNKYNWTSLLIGFDKPFTNPLADLTTEQIENYLHFCKLAEENYKFIVRNNPTPEELANKIHKP